MAGAITTCYSFKGGSGRSMSLANMAWSLAARGDSVLAIDWDLEAPGLHRYFHPFLDDPTLERTEGLIDGLWSYVRSVPEGAGKRPGPHANMSRYVRELATPFERGGSISLLAAGRQDADYTAKVGGFDWNLFYERMNGREFIDALGTWARGRYDHVLIDSRTGVSDTAGVCTVQLPDTVALFFVYNRQSIEGTAAAGRAVLAQRQKRGVTMIACPSRVEDRRQADPARWYAATCLEDVLRKPTKEITEQLRLMEVQHFAWCGYEEKLAAFEERPEETGTLLQSMDALTDRIAGRGGDRESIPQEQLDKLWRRAAFRDPRLEELESLRSASLGQRLPQIQLWLAETLEDSTPNRAWISGLALEATSLMLQSRTGDPADMDAVGESAVALVRRFLRRDEDCSVIAEVLRARAIQLRHGERLDEAFEVVSEALDVSLVETVRGGSLNTLRSLELRAELARTMHGAAAAIPHYRAFVERTDYRADVRGGAVVSMKARARRILAEVLFEAGEPGEARKVAETAVKLASRTRAEPRAPGSRRSSPEPALARTVLAQAAIAAGDADARDIVVRTIAWAQRADLPKSNRIDLEATLRIALARRLLAAGDVDAADLELQALHDDLPTWAVVEIAALRASITSPSSGKIAATPDDLASFLQTALREAGDDPGRRETVLRHALARVVDAPGENVTLLLDLIRSDIDPNMRDLILTSLRDMVSGSAREKTDP